MFSPDLSSNPLKPELEQHENLLNNDLLKKELWEKILGSDGINIQQLTIKGSIHGVQAIRLLGVTDDGFFSHVIVGIKFTNESEEHFATANLFPATGTVVFDMLNIPKNRQLQVKNNYSGIVAKATGFKSDFERLKISELMKNLTPEIF